MLPKPLKQWVARTFKLSKTADGLLNALSAHLGLSRTGVLEVLIREKAAKEKIKIEEEA